MPTGSLTPFEIEHARSIGDERVTLAPIPPAKVAKILIGVVIRKSAQIVQAFLDMTAAQKLRRPTELSWYLITDFGPTDAFAGETMQLLDDFAAKTPRVYLRHNVNAGDDFTDIGPTHQWSTQAWHRVGALKNDIFQACLGGQYDGLWLLDADVLCDPYTLQSLADCELPVVAGVYWTLWQKPKPGSTEVIHAGPQVWLRHPYVLSGHGYSEPEFRKALVDRQLLRVWGLGACTLFHRSALEKGVHFTPVPEGLPPGPMSDGEDRHLCERARRLHLPLFADAWPDIWHCYHADEIGAIAQWRARLSAEHPQVPGFGDSVSVRLDLLESIPHPQNPGIIQQLGPQFWRGRLGTGALLPELEEAVAGLQSGDRQIVTLHYPGHYEYQTLASQQRLVAVTLLDTKPYRVPPVVEQELFVGNHTGAWLDSTTLTASQIDDVTETIAEGVA